MYKRYIYKLCAVLFLVSFSGMGTLLAQTQEQIDQFNKERKTYFTEKLELTEAEGKAFWPLYEDFANRKMKLVEDERNTYQYANKNADHLSDKEIKETLAKAFRLKEEQLALEKDFYQNKFMTVLPAKKVMKLGKVEWDFRRHLMRKLREQGDGDYGNRNSGSSRGGSGSGSSGSGQGGMGLPPAYF
ncbi:MAG: hypothetical protein E4H10_07480 [Bacteroidia bacterium]|nr:MAG: hypothetical protein E4H10_07480 [Bacteroidia bacterium]